MEEAAGPAIDPERSITSARATARWLAWIGWAGGTARTSRCRAPPTRAMAFLDGRIVSSKRLFIGTTPLFIWSSVTAVLLLEGHHFESAHFEPWVGRLDQADREVDRPAGSMDWEADRECGDPVSDRVGGLADSQHAGMRFDAVDPSIHVNWPRRNTLDSYCPPKWPFHSPSFVCPGDSCASRLAARNQ